VGGLERPPAPLTGARPPERLLGAGRRWPAPLIVSLALCALAALACANLARASFPSKGVVVPGQSIATVGLGMTEAAVVSHWGRGYVVCASCSLTTWLFEYRGSEPLGAAVKFNRAGRVVAVFTLGSPAGWGVKGVMMGDPVSNVYSLFGNTGNVACIGYSALTVRIGSSMTSFYSASGTIYGFALTASTQPACQ
jgi:hypothetical protein